MKASETKFQPIIEGTKQYVVPLFQRAYSWERREWDILWEDIKDLCENEEPKNHFIGSIVTMPTPSVPEGVGKYLLIDGQQRLTTIFIILCLLRDKAIEIGNEELGHEIQQTMLVNPFKKENDYFKLLPTQVDRLAFQSLIKREPLEDDSQIIKCYKFFEKKINSSNIIDVNKVITSRFSVVSILLDYDDNPHLVFESLNAKGRQLTQSDLIRNYFFMRIHVNEQEDIYNRFWNPMQSNLKEDLTECIRHYLMRNGVIVKQGDVYFTLKDRVEKGDALKSLEQIAIFAGYYQKLINPSLEPDISVRTALLRINRLEITTSYPFLLNCYHDYTLGDLSSKGFTEVLHIIENYILRRFVCNYLTNQYNKVFPFLYDWAKSKNPSDFIQGLREALQERGYPNDTAFKTQLIQSKLYGKGERAVKTKLILETLESYYEHKEQVPFDGLSIEHVLPQTPTDWWKHHLGEDWQADYELAVHTLGNLTLTAYNSELSNDAFPKKQGYLQQSHLELNKYFQDIEHWNRDAIEERADILSNIALQCWPYFGSDKPVTFATSAEDVTGKTPQALIFLGSRMPVDSWRQVLLKTLNTIADIEPELFEVITREYTRFISSDNTRFKRKSELDNGYFVDVNLRARDIYRLCEQIIVTIGLSQENWIVETN